MCGICGFINFDGRVIDEKVAHHMVEILHHRGPDGRGYYIKQSNVSSSMPSIFLGHARLKVIDLTDSAKQPLCNENGNIWIVFNGEIYNFIELREYLKKKGHIFRSRSDTEVIVHAYEEFGCRVVEYLDGMFSFAIWDEKEWRMLLARDRTGKKPLYYHFNGNYFTFASEIKGLLQCPWVGCQVDEDRIPDYFFFGYIIAPNTLYKNIVQLPPASYLVVNKKGINGPSKYWQICLEDETQDKDITIEKASEHVKNILKNAVLKRLISDVPLGALLSGGLDSSIVVGIMSELIKSPVRTFSIGFTEDRSFDESSYARQVANHFKTEHTEFKIKINALSLMEQLLWNHDQPYGDSAAIPTYLVCQLTRKYVTVALNGDGGDEVFGGYDRFRAALIANKMPNFFWNIGRVISRFIPRSYSYFSLKRRMERFFIDSKNHSPLSMYITWIAIFNDDLLAELIKNKIYESPMQQLTYIDGLKMPLLHKILYLNFTTYLPDDLNVKMDRMSMANSLETRSPFLDTSLIEFAASLPPEMKIRKRLTKFILRHAFKDMLPKGILNRPKHGFGMPLALWFKSDLGNQFRELLLSNNARSGIYLDLRVVKRLFNDHIKGRSDNSYKLWAILQFELWLRMIGQKRDYRPLMNDYMENITVQKGLIKN